MKKLFGLALLVLSCSNNQDPNQQNSLNKPQLNLESSTSEDFELTGLMSSKDSDDFIKRVLVKFKGKAEEKEFKDFDKDGDLDFVFKGYILEKDKKVYGTFCCENDGKGNFAQPRLIKQY